MTAFSMSVLCLKKAGLYLADDWLMKYCPSLVRSYNILFQSKEAMTGVPPWQN
jgi:hypothetical protein